MAIVSNLYEKDFYAWANEQKELLHAQEFNKLDVFHLEEELRLMGVSERKELMSRLKILLAHLLKWKYQPALQSKSWRLTVKVQRNELKHHLRDNPSLKAKVDTFLADAYTDAVLLAAAETSIDEEKFPQQCEWSIEQILNDEFFP